MYEVQRWAGWPKQPVMVVTAIAHAEAGDEHPETG